MPIIITTIYKDKVMLLYIYTKLTCMPSILFLFHPSLVLPTSIDTGAPH